MEPISKLSRPCNGPFKIIHKNLGYPICLVLMLIGSRLLGWNWRYVCRTQMISYLDHQKYRRSKSHIPHSLKHLKILTRRFTGGLNGHILYHHIMSLEYGLQFLETFFELYLLRYHGEDVKLEQAYADLREEMKHVIFKSGTNEYDVMLNKFSGIIRFLCGKIDELGSDLKADQVTPMMKELENIMNMLSLLEPSFEYERGTIWCFKTKSEEEKKIFATVTSVLDRAACFIYLSFIGKMDDEMALSLKSILSDLIIEETQIMKMYLILDIDSTGNLKSHISMSLRLLEWNKKFYLGTDIGAPLKDHFMSIKNGLQFLGEILEISRFKDLKLRIQHLVVIVKQKLYSLPQNQEDENLIMNLEHAYGELREEMQNVVIKAGTNDYCSLFPETLEEVILSRTKDFLLKKIVMLVATSCKADQIAPIMEELEELRKKLTSLPNLLALNDNVRRKFLDALTPFLDRATCLIYLSLVGMLNEDMLGSLKKNLSLLIEETKIKEMSIALGMTWEDDIDISLSLLKTQERYYIGTINEAMLKDHIMSLEHGIEFLKWIPKIYINTDTERHIILLVRDIKKKLELLAYLQGDESLNMDLNCTYGDLRVEMKNVITNREITEDILFPDFSRRFYHYRGYHDFLLEKVATLITSNYKVDQIAPLKKELQDLLGMLTFLKPLSHCAYSIWTTLITVHQKATIIIYLSFVGKMDAEMMLLVKSNISAIIKETDVREMYTMILNEVVSKRDNLEEDLHLLETDVGEIHTDILNTSFRHCLEEKLCLLENLILLLKSNVESLNDANSKLYEALIDIHSFLIGLSPNMLLRKLHLLQTSFQAIVDHSIPIVCSCYIERTEENISVELNCVLDLIKHIKSEVHEIKLYYFPTNDDLGFLEFFSGYLKDLMKNEEISMKEEIDALHFEVQSLLSLAKVRNLEELNGTPWDDIINMAYQAEYIIDYIISSSDLRLISSLSKIVEQLKNIRADVCRLCYKSLPAEDVAETSEPHVLGTTTQGNDNDAIVGLQEEAIIITEYLLNGENGLDFISIVGMAGVGKTTLALTLYKTLSTDHHFDILAWCTVSQSYQTRDLLLSILDQVNASNKRHRSISDDQELSDHFCRSLKKRRYLIVLDDMWDTVLSNYLKRCLPDDRVGSRILITTRNRDVADQIGSKVNELHGLSDDKSWELFEKKMLNNESLSDNLLKVSKGIVDHCKGLPLSIVIIAGILSDIERTEEKWNQIAKSVSSLVLSEPQGKCKAIIELSYNHLPNHLKSCFLYLGSFPEDEEILVDRVILLWIVEGLVRDTKSNSLEEVAKNYMEDLVAKSLVIPSKERSRGGVKTFRLHDLLRDFCLDKAKEKNFFTLYDWRYDSPPLQDPRRLIIKSPSCDFLNFSCHSIRSMICFSGLKASEIKKGIESCDMVLLKVLDVNVVLLKVSSKLFLMISSLCHLRYLALSLENRRISILPSPMSRLKNLHILILRCSCDVMKVPDFIFDMVKLRHVYISPEASFQIDSNRLENSSFLLENLKFLFKARVSCGGSKWLRKLQGLERLCCVFVDNEDCDEEYEDLEVNDEEDDDLKVDDDPEDNQSQKMGFNGHLTSLKVKNAIGREQRFLSTCRLPVNLRELSLSEFFLQSNDISEIGRVVPHLEVLKIYSCYVPSGYEWSVDDEEFPELKVLKLRDLEISKWIVSEYSFPSLEQLYLEKCDYLEKIPTDFGSLLQLRLISVRECAPSVDDSAREIERLQHEDQNIEMTVRVYPRK